MEDAKVCLNMDDHRGVSAFAGSRTKRDNKCKGKDEVLIPILDGLNLSKPKNFRAILMPCLFGREGFYLIGHGVPASNIVCLERDKEIWEEIRYCRNPERKALKGIVTTEQPCSSAHGITWVSDVYPRWQFDFVYMDYFSRMNLEHIEGVLAKLLRLRMLKKRATLVLTFGENRAREKIVNFDRNLRKLTNKPCEAVIAYLVKKLNYPKPSFYDTQSYISNAGKNRRLTYHTTLVKWE